MSTPPEGPFSTFGNATLTETAAALATTDPEHTTLRAFALLNLLKNSRFPNSTPWTGAKGGRTLLDASLPTMPERVADILTGRGVLDKLDGVGWVGFVEHVLALYVLFTEVSLADAAETLRARAHEANNALEAHERRKEDFQGRRDIGGAEKRWAERHAFFEAEEERVQLELSAMLTLLDEAYATGDVQSVLTFLGGLKNFPVQPGYVTTHAFAASDRVRQSRKRMRGARLPDGREDLDDWSV